jgi:hypothetical protein
VGDCVVPELHAVISSETMAIERKHFIEHSREIQISDQERKTSAGRKAFNSPDIRGSYAVAVSRIAPCRGLPLLCAAFATIPTYSFAFRRL